MPSRAYERIRREALDRAGWRCTSCGLAGALQVHHVVQLWRGGKHEPDNCRVLCGRCHLIEHRRAGDLAGGGRDGAGAEPAAAAGPEKRQRQPRGDPEWRDMVGELLDG